MRMTVQKRRLQTLVDGAMLEQTEIRVSLGGDRPAELWQTVALEGKRKLCMPVLPKVRASCEAQAGEGGLWKISYPTFVLEVATRITAAGDTAVPLHLRAPLQPPETLKGFFFDFDGTLSVALWVPRLQEERGCSLRLPACAVGEAVRSGFPASRRNAACQSAARVAQHHMCCLAPLRRTQR